jgi:hypothetical protein
MHGGGIRHSRLLQLEKTFGVQSKAIRPTGRFFNRPVLILFEPPTNIFRPLHSRRV